MSATVKKRVRMFAGPNGSGKSTIKAALPPTLIGTYVNPDEIERQLQEESVLNLEQFGIDASQEEIACFLGHSSFLKQAGIALEPHHVKTANKQLSLPQPLRNAYVASVLSDFIRHQLLKAGHSFTFETVMSSPDKVEFLRKAQKAGYRTYLYFVATKDPIINISRVQNRVECGGHPVPEDKILARYFRSLDLLYAATLASNRAYIFDNSSHEHLIIAEVTEGKEIEMKTDQMPDWFKTALWDKYCSMQRDGLQANDRADEQQ